MGIEPTTEAWEAAVLPLHQERLNYLDYIRFFLFINSPFGLKCFRRPLPLL